MDAISEQRLQLVHPDLAAKIRQISESGPIRVTQGLRTYIEQDALYAQGRTTPGSIVTHARGGESWHNFGLAVDVVPMKDGQPDWDGPWEGIIAAGEALALVSGKSFHDRPHFQMTGRFPVSPTNEIREIYLAGGIPAVWEAAFPHDSSATATG